MPGGDSLRHPRHGEFMPDVPQAGTQPPKKQQAHQEDKKKRLKDTLNLPKTDFAMKANLPTREPERLAIWESAGLYEQIRRARTGAPKYILHDGPPYANGAIHLGHALNKCIKDFVVKTKTMAGFDSPYVPGWDCHGLPIEIKVDEQLGGRKLELNPIEVRQACREYAQKYIDLQRTQFKRLGVLGRWDDPYSTMNFPYEARIVETFYGFFEKGFVYKGLKPVYWCWHDRTALAEAEVEYEMHTSPSVYVRYKLTSPPEQIDPRLAGKEVYTIIWTTTPWTLPASMAVAFNPEIEYVALDDGKQSTSSRAMLAAAHARSLQRDRRPQERRRARKLPRRQARAHHLRPSLPRPRRSSASSPTTSPPSKAPAPFTPHPRTAPTTSRPASSTTCR